MIQDLAHPSMASFLFKMLSCRYSAGQRYLDVDMLEPCDQGRWLYYTICLVIPSIIIYIFGLPIFAFIYIYRRMHLAKEDRIRHRLMQFRVGFLFSGFREETWWWELLVLSRKMLIVVIATFGKADSLQVHYALGFFVAFAAIHVHSDPFESKRSDRFEITSLILLCFILWAAVFYSLEGQCSAPENTGWCNFLGFLAISSNVIFLIVAIISFFQAWLKKNEKVLNGIARKLSVTRRISNKSHTEKNNSAPVHVDNGESLREQHGEVKIDVDNPFITEIELQKVNKKKQRSVRGKIRMKADTKNKKAFGQNRMDSRELDKR